MTLTAQIHVALEQFTLDAELSVASGQTIALVGPNGAGKTTMLHAIAGLRALTSGRIELDGVVLDEPSRGVYVPPERRPVGVVFQDNLLFPHLSAVDNVAYGLRARGIGRSQARTTATGWLERVGLERHAAARPHQLSGGQAQRVALARALATEPAVLLLDEPLAALDATTRNEVRRDLRRHLSTFAGVRVLITHDPIDAAVLADHVIVLDDGEVAQTGSPEEITRHPRTRWVADLAGTNLFGGVASADRHVALDEGGVLVSADEVTPGRVFAVVHPRAVAIHRSRPEGSPRNTWPGRVTAVERLGDRFRVQIDGQPSIVAEVTSGAVQEVGLTDGADVWVAVKATEIDVYPA
ncbi:MAG TPA: ABC transporter ATP-binding protein [Acidimicrobiales bacterium]|nr:ABC transporter ATP-binding protein [Acidimicrobiales bacterium]